MRIDRKRVSATRSQLGREASASRLLTSSPEARRPSEGYNATPTPLATTDATVRATRLRRACDALDAAGLLHEVEALHRAAIAGDGGMMQNMMRRVQAHRLAAVDGAIRGRLTLARDALGALWCLL